MADTQQNLDQKIDELIDRIDSFMANGGGRMNVSGGDGEPSETHCHACCGESADGICHVPAQME